ncbi:hypothetical protein AAC387_Pa02g1682 [Persea americana]
MAFMTTLIAAVVMATNKQIVEVFTFHVQAKFMNSPSFSFLVGGNAIASFYALLSLPLVFTLNFQRNSISSFFIFLFDLGHAQNSLMLTPPNPNDPIQPLSRSPSPRRRQKPLLIISSSLNPLILLITPHLSLSYALIHHLRRSRHPNLAQITFIFTLAIPSRHAQSSLAPSLAVSLAAGLWI